MGRNRNARALDPTAFEPESSSPVESERKLERSIRDGQGKHLLKLPSSKADSSSGIDSARDVNEQSSGYQRSKQLKTSGLIVVWILVITGIVQNLYSLTLILTNYFDF